MKPDYEKMAKAIEKKIRNVIARCEIERGGPGMPGEPYNLVAALRAAFEPEPEPAKEPVYETAEECVKAIAADVWAASRSDMGASTRGMLRLHISRYRPCDRDAVVEECGNAISSVIKRTVCSYERDGLHRALEAVRALKGKRGE